jgi:hypothetical protein
VTTDALLGDAGLADPRVKAVVVGVLIELRQRFDGEENHRIGLSGNAIPEPQDVQKAYNAFFVRHGPNLSEAATGSILWLMLAFATPFKLFREFENSCSM